MRRVIVIVAFGALLAGFTAVSTAGARSTKHYQVYEYSLGPKRVSISRGTTVVWTWTGLKPHSVSTASGPTHFSSRVQKHGKFSYTFMKRGVYHLFCQVHPDMMKMTIVVK